MRKLQNIQALRGIAVLSVVLFHLATIEQKYGGKNAILPEFFDFGMFGVDLFFVISGFVMVVVTKGKFQNIKQAVRFLYHRASRIYPTYWVYSILVLGVFIIRPSLFNRSLGNQVDILASFLLWPSENFPLVIVGWTLIHEIYFYVIFFIVLLITPEKHLFKAMLLWGSGVALSNLFLELASPISHLVFHPLTIEFISGCFLSILYFRINNQMLKTSSLLILALMGISAAIYGLDLYQDATGYIYPHGWWRILIFGVPATLLVFCFIYLERNGYVAHSIFIKVGDASYSIYLSHVLILTVTGKIWSTFSSDLAYDNVIILPVQLFLVIIAGIMSFNFIEKPLLAFSRRNA